MVFDAATRERRIRQFEHYLGLMEHRALQVVDNDCFIIFGVTLSPEQQEQSGVKSRFVQFACQKNGLHLDLPDSTLTGPEAWQAIAKNRSFRFLVSRSINGEGRDPLCAHYEYHQSRRAAEDTAYFFFDLWRISVDAWIDVSAFEVGDNDDDDDDTEVWEAVFSIG